MATKANPPKGPISNLPAGPEHRQRSSNQFCRCSHNRSFQALGLRHICGDLKCECVKHDTAVASKKDEAPTVVADGPVDSHLLDRVLMAGALAHLQKRIDNAKHLLRAGLVMRLCGRDDVATRRFEDALAALGNLGAS